MAAGFGLSSALFTAIYRNVFQADDNVDHYLLTVTVTLAIVIGLGVVFLRIDPELNRPTLTHLANNPNNPSGIGMNQKERENEDLTGWALMKHPEFVGLFFLFMFSASSGLMVIGEIADIALSNGMYVYVCMYVCKYT